MGRGPLGRCGRCALSSRWASHIPRPRDWSHGSTCISIPYRGLRDAGKWAAPSGARLLAVGWAGSRGNTGLASNCGSKILERPSGRPASPPPCWLLPLFYGNGLLFGAHGEIKPSQYPAGWYQADRVLAADHNPGRTLVLPWHEYMSYSFIQNQNRVVAPPAPSFFSVPVLTSTNPEVPGVVPPDGPDQTAVSALVRAGTIGQWAHVLAAHGRQIHTRGPRARLELLRIPRRVNPDSSRSATLAPSSSTATASLPSNWPRLLGLCNLPVVVTPRLTHA